MNYKEYVKQNRDVTVFLHGCLSLLTKEEVFDIIYIIIRKGVGFYIMNDDGDSTKPPSMHMIDYNEI